MKLWLIKRRGDWDYDDFDAAVVAADTSDDARLTHPGGGDYVWDGDRWSMSGLSDWVSPDRVNVTLLGEAAPGIERGVVLSSFNAG